jgi:hypothetical protein
MMTGAYLEATPDFIASALEHGISAQLPDIGGQRSAARGIFQGFWGAAICFSVHPGATT